MFRNFKVLLILFLLFADQINAQQKISSAADIQLGLQKLNTLGSVLYFAAHPDDENTRLIAWLAQEKKYRTAYLSLTRGDGGQNLIGTEIGINLGLIRTQELLAARRIDKGEQFFTSAYDFGFSKTSSETFDFWEKQTALREAVWIIRKFRPDIIITRFPPDERGGHGHHQASAMLAHEAYLAAADPTMFTDQLQEVTIWKAKRIVWNTFNFGGANTISEDQLKIDIGAYNSLLGQSYGEIAADSRSQHKSQGFGAAALRGKSIEYFEHVAGDKANQTLMDGVNTTWNRIANTQKVQQYIDQLNNTFDQLYPAKSLPTLLLLRKEILSIQDIYWREQKLKEVEDLILACAGIWTDAITISPSFAINENFTVHIEAIVRQPNVAAKITKIGSKTVNQPLANNELYKDTYTYKWDNITQPYWLVKPRTNGKFQIETHEIGFPTNPKKPSLTLHIEINGQVIAITKEIQYRHVDPVHGEIYSPVVINPKITAQANTEQILSVNGEVQTVDITFTRHDKTQQTYALTTGHINGWSISPNAIQLDFGESDIITQTFQIKPTTQHPPKAIIDFKLQNELVRTAMHIRYTHIPDITWFPALEISCQYVDLKHEIKKVGYIQGAGDLVSQSLNLIGIETSTLDEKKISANNLKQYDAVIVGVRHYNINPLSDKVAKELQQYVRDGGVVLVQYHVNSKLFTKDLGPYPFQLSRARVTEEAAKVDFDKTDRALSFPNKISDKDFENWVQERALYFADQIDTKYRTPLSMNDKNESPSKGSLLIASHGNGKFVYTSLSFFRQLPAGVPGAYRLFVNLLSKEQ